MEGFNFKIKMKNYYYFLGVPADASPDEIRKVYRKLSTKYHPDKNDNDAFFAERFREVQEAYETLINEESRRNFDKIYFENFRKTQYELPPNIKNFSVNKTKISKGEEIIITWQTNNADVVKILPFGLVSAYGEKRIKITEFKSGKFHIVLQAMNTMINKSVVKGISISEISDNEEDILEAKPKITRKIPSKFIQNRIKTFILFIVLLSVLLAIHFILKAIVG